jgi:hypothetical protein
MPENQSLIRRYWHERGGTLVEDFLAFRLNLHEGKKLLNGATTIDGVIILRGPHRVARYDEVEIRDKDVVIVHARAGRVDMPLLGKALFSWHLMEAFQPRNLESIVVCNQGDRTLDSLAAHYGIRIVVYEV